MLKESEISHVTISFRQNYFYLFFTLLDANRTVICRGTVLITTGHNLKLKSLNRRRMINILKARTH